MIKLVAHSIRRGEDLPGFLNKHGFRFDGQVEASDRGPAEWIWAHPANGSEFHLIDDQWIGVPYAVLTGERAHALRDELIANFGFMDQRDILSLSRAELSEAEMNVLAASLGVLAPSELDDGWFAAIRRCLEAPWPSVKQRAIRACTYVGWPELALHLAALTSDDNTLVRNAAAMALAAFAGQRLQ